MVWQPIAEHDTAVKQDAAPTIWPTSQPRMLHWDGGPTEYVAEREVQVHQLWGVTHLL